MRHLDDHPQRPFDPKAIRRRGALMRALCWHGTGDMRVDSGPDPRIRHPRDAIILITACAISGVALHPFDGFQPALESGDILGHKNMDVVVELGLDVTNLRAGDRVVVPFTIRCGQCRFCRQGICFACDRTNPNAEIAIKAMWQSPAGAFGFPPVTGATGPRPPNSTRWGARHSTCCT